MDSKSITRKDFFLLTFTLIGAGAAACSSSSNNTDGGKGGSGGGGGAGGSGGSGGGGAGGASDGGGGGTGGASDGGGDGSSACNDPLNEAQVPDATGHTHTLTVPAATLNATTTQTISTGSAGTVAHVHAVMFTPAELLTLKQGGSVNVTSAPTNDHMHVYAVSCTAILDGGGQ